MLCELCVGGVVIALTVLILLTVQVPREPDNDKMEEHFVGGAKVPDFVPDATVDLSVVIPAYNETDRLPDMLAECIECLKTAKQKTWEVIVVDDGSKDNTKDIVAKIAPDDERVKCLSLHRNRGKGHAVKMGMMASSGERIFFADADRAMPFGEFQKLNEKFDYLSEAYPDLIVIGSRAHLEKNSIAHRSLFRTLLMKAFHMLVYIFCVRTVNDTQCGYKLFSRRAAVKILPNLHIQRWAFDVELLFIAEAFKMKVSETAIKWEEIDGTKMTPVLSWIQMARDLAMIWFRYLIGYWCVKM